MKRAIYINNKKQVLFLLVPPRDVSDGYMLSLPGLEVEVLESAEFTNKISRILYGMHVDKNNFNNEEFTSTYFMTEFIPCIYSIVPVFKQDVRDSKFIYLWLNKLDIKNLRESNAQMLKDNYEIINDVYKALI